MPDDTLSPRLRLARTATHVILGLLGVVLLLGPLLRFSVMSAWRWATEARSPDWWGATGQWAGALGTIAAVVVALWIAIRDGRHAQLERDQRTQQEHRAHVAKLSAWNAGAPQDGREVALIEITNSSDEPFYEVVVFPVFIQGAAPHTGEELTRALDGYPNCAVLGAVQPGRWVVEVPPLDHVLSAQYGVEVACRDRSGTSWIRRASGELQEISTNPIDHYGLARPLGYQDPTRLKD